MDHRWLCSLICLLPAPAMADDPARVDFQRDIYPALEQNCIACHNVAINESKLVLEEVKDIVKGGKRGTSIVAKQPDKSLLYLVASRKKKPHMPPLPNNQDAKAFTPRELGLLRQWILEGAVGSKGGNKQIGNLFGVSK